jgi:hypothetical protein
VYVCINLKNDPCCINIIIIIVGPLQVFACSSEL